MNLTVFNFNDHEVRIESIDGAPWWNANDVCAILGYSNPRDAIAKHCRADGVAKRDTIDSMGRTQSVSYINEPNLYRLITRSKLPAAEPFESWVFDEVLPTIRKTGGYGAPALDPITELNRFAGLVNQVTQINEGRFAAIGEKLALIEDAQRKVDPRQLAEQAAKEMIRRDMEVSRLKHEIRIGWIQRIVKLAGGQQGKIASEWDSFSKVWRKLHKFTGLNKFDDYRTPDVCRAALSYLEGVFKSLDPDASEPSLFPEGV